MKPHHKKLCDPMWHVISRIFTNCYIRTFTVTFTFRFYFRGSEILRDSVLLYVMYTWVR